MVVIETGTGCEAARRHAVTTVFRDFLGLDATILIADRHDWRISVPGQASSLTLPDAFFARAGQAWLSPESLPPPPLRISRQAGDLPVLYGANHSNCEASRPSGTGGHIEIDIFGAIFFMLTRYEEATLTDRDRHGRFPATASLASQAGFLQRPLVDEYVNLLWRHMQAVWPGITRRACTFQVHPSHDVDTPYSHAITGLATATRRLAGDLFKRHSAKLAARRFSQWARVRSGNIAADPYDTHDWLMDASERLGTTSTFHFMAGRTDPRRDGGYAIGHPLIRRLLKRIHQRGHTIGLHPSFNTYCNATEIRRELQRLCTVCREEGIDQPLWPSRQHYLRWDARVTPRMLAEAGIEIDASLGYPDAAGFRCGTCHEFQLFDLVAGEPLPTRERPLIVMDQTILSPAYMGMAPDETTLALIGKLKDHCRNVAGNFSLLWHNSTVSDSKAKAFYLDVLAL